jgi:hypothetical protein
MSVAFCSHSQHFEVYKASKSNIVFAPLRMDDDFGSDISDDEIRGPVMAE